MPTVERVVFSGTVSEETPRNQVLYRGLTDSGCHVDVVDAPKLLVEWGSEIKQQWLLTFFVQLLLENVVVFAICLRNVGTIRRADVIFVPSYGNYCSFAVATVGRIVGVPVVLDGHGSIYYTQIHGRKYYTPESTRGQVYWFLDRWSIKVVDSYLVFSEAMRDQFADTYDVPADAFGVVYTGALRPAQRREMDGLSCDTAAEHGPDFEDNPDVEASPTDVLYWGTFVSFHGVDTMVEALAACDARSSTPSSAVFTGVGETRDACIERANEHGLENVSFPGWVSEGVLEAYIDAAGVTLGTFGGNPYIELCLTNKLCEAAARGKPILTQRSPAVEELFEHGHDVYMTHTTDVDEIADDLLYLLSDQQLRRRLSENAVRTYERNLSPAAIAEQFYDVAVPLVDPTQGT